MKECRNKNTPSFFILLLYIVSPLWGILERFFEKIASFHMCLQTLTTIPHSEKKIPHSEKVPL